MRAHWRAGRRGMALLAALSMVLVSAPGSSAEEEEGTKNLSTPVILADENVSDLFNPVTVPGGPTGDADYTKASLDYYTGVGSDTYTSGVDQDFNADSWGADWVFEDTDEVGALAKWGDNLVSHQFPGNGTQPIRVEMNLFADADTAAAYGEMEGYAMVSLEGTMRDELFGTLGVAEAISPMVFTPDHNLTILKYSSATGRYTIPVYDGPMSVEVNGSGKLIYGLVWGTAGGLANPTQGNYRLIFTVGSDSLVNLTGIMESEDEEGEEGPLHTPMLYGDKISYLDISMGAALLNPPLPFGPGPKSDFNGDHNPDVITRNSAGRLFLHPGNGTGGWLSTIAYGYGWNAFTALVAVGDWNGDDANDLMARDSSGRLYLYPGNGTGGWLPRVAYGYGWNAMTAIVGMGDFNGDDNPDLMARQSDGRLWLYPGNGTGGFLPRVAYGYGWNAMTSILGVGDFNSDGTMDLAARDTAGQFWLYAGNGTGGWIAGRTLIGTGWQRFTALVAPWDFSGDGNVDVMARNSLGQLYLFQGDGDDYWKLPAKLIGTGWNVFTAIVA